MTNDHLSSLIAYHGQQIFNKFGVLSLEFVVEHSDLFATDVAHAVKVVRLEQICLCFFSIQGTVFSWEFSVQQLNN